MQIEKHPLKITIEKTGEMVFFSQIDLIHVLERALRRSNLPLYYTQGYNPRVKISFSNGLKLGLTGKIETTFYFLKPVSFEQLDVALSAELPAGLKIHQQ